MEWMPSIFNDVLSPVTPGPSSSNTCGPYRIARLARALLGEPPRRITVRMARRGGYYDTFYSMHSHEAILAALLGQELLRCDLSTMCRQADEAGLCYDFQFVDDLPVRPSELAEMDLSGDRRTIRLTGVSLGGGEIEITRLNGSDILLRGKRLRDEAVLDQHIAQPLLCLLLECQSTLQLLPRDGPGRHQQIAQAHIGHFTHLPVESPSCTGRNKTHSPHRRI